MVVIVLPINKLSYWTDAEWINCLTEYKLFSDTQDTKGNLNDEINGTQCISETLISL